MRWTVLIVALSFSLLLFGQDVIFLDGGGKVKGTIIEENEDFIIVKTKAGEIPIKRERIERIEYGAGFQEEYQRRIDELDKEDPDAWYELGVWCRMKGYEKEAEDCFRKAIEIDPDHKESREELGYYKLEGKWVTEDEYWRAQGYEKYGGVWLPKEEVERLKTRRKARKKKETSKEGSESDEEADAAEEPPPDPSADPSGGLARNLRQKRNTRFIPPEDPKERKEWIKKEKERGGWKVVYESKHYIFFSNAPYDTTKMYAHMMDRVYKEYKKIFQYKGKQKRPFVITMYGSYQEFLRKERKPPGVGGFYDGTRISCPCGRVGRLDTKTVLLHEGTHQFQGMVWPNMLSLTRVPGAIWFVEGLAVYFESGTFDPSTGAFRLTLNKNRLSTLKRAMASGRFVRIERLLEMTQRGFGAYHYAHAYGLVYFLVNYSKAFRKKFKKYFDAFTKPGVKPKEEFIKLFGDDWDRLNEAWRKYILSL